MDSCLNNHTYDLCSSFAASIEEANSRRLSRVSSAWGFALRLCGFAALRLCGFAALRLASGSPGSSSAGGSAGGCEVNCNAAFGRPRSWPLALALSLSLAARFL